MLLLSFVVAIMAAALLGYHYRQLKDTLEALKTAQEDRKKPKVSPRAMLLDPDDAVQRARYEHEAMLKKLNGGE